jgi:hypothetical protein
MRHALTRRLARPHRLALFTAALLVAGGAAIPAQAQEEGENKSLTESLLTGFGLVAPTPPDIDYRERAPLVVPQNADVLPPPMDDALAANPAWPKDAEEVERQKQAAADAKVTKQHSRYDGIDPRPLKPAEVAGGKRASTAGAAESGFGLKDSDNHISPSQMEFKGWGNIFNAGQEKPLVFTGEPERQALVEPPPGYRTPAPNAPYGTVEKKNEGWKLPNWFDRTTPKN